MYTIGEEAVDKAVRAVEQRTGYEFSKPEVDEIFVYALRKCEVARKGYNYIPIMLETELEDYISRQVISTIGAMNNV